MLAWLRGWTREAGVNGRIRPAVSGATAWAVQIAISGQSFPQSRAGAWPGQQSMPEGMSIPAW
jgi:hypothetical protein